MSQTKIGLPTKLALVGRAGGRCEYPGCNRRLDVEDLTARPLNRSVFAHIVADRPDGPRGDPVRSVQLASDIDNLMLLCFDHHKLIDVDAVHDHPEDTLRLWKREHEERIAALLECRDNLRTRIVVLKANVGGRTPVLPPEAIRKAVWPMYPAGPEFVVDLTALGVRDHEPRFWTVAEEEIVRQVRADLRPALLAPAPAPTALSVFALAPIPLLMVLGRELGDIASVRVFQKLRHPDTWSWQNAPEVPDDRFVIERPSNVGAEPAVALALSVSGLVHDQEVEAVLGAGVPIWRVSASRTGDLNFVRTEGLLLRFSVLFRQVLHDIRAVHGPAVQVHVFPAVPNSVAVECGRVLLPKADPALAVHDRPATRWPRVLDLLGPSRAV